MKEPKIVKLTLENGATVTVPNGMTISDALKLAEAVEEKVKPAHVPEQGDVYAYEDDGLAILTNDGRNTVLRGVERDPGELGYWHHKEFLEKDYLGKFWEVFGLKSDHQKEIEKLRDKYDRVCEENKQQAAIISRLQNKHNDLVDKVVEAIKTEDHDGDSIVDGGTLWTEAIEKIHIILLSTGEPRIIEALGGGE